MTGIQAAVIDTDVFSVLFVRKGAPELSRAQPGGVSNLTAVGSSLPSRPALRC